MHYFVGVETKENGKKTTCNGNELGGNYIRSIRAPIHCTNIIPARNASYIAAVPGLGFLCSILVDKLGAHIGRWFD